MSLRPSEDYQSPVNPVNIDPSDPNALSLVIELAKQVVIKNNELNERLKVVEDIVLD